MEKIPKAELAAQQAFHVNNLMKFCQLLQAKPLLLSSTMLALSVASQAGQAAYTPPIPKQFYIGVLGGYGSTTWNGLVPSNENINLATNLSTPIEVKEGGGVWGFFTGYELSPNFALEVSYLKYPSATVIFDEVSLFTFLNNGLTEYNTQTETANLMGKLMIYLPKTAVRVFSSAGLAALHRNDILLNEWRYDPTFGLGINYHFTEHLMGEVAGNYTAGFGEAQLNPTNTYFPFLYSISARLAFCFDVS